MNSDFGNKLKKDSRTFTSVKAPKPIKSTETGSLLKKILSVITDRSLRMSEQKVLFLHEAAGKKKETL